MSYKPVFYAPFVRRLPQILAVLLLLSAALLARPAYAAMTINVTTTADNTSNDGLCSLREALSYTNGAPANLNCGPDTGSPYTINIPIGTYNLSLDELQVGAPGNRMVTINGAGAVNTIINQTNSSYRVFDLDPMVVGNVDVIITGVTISGGCAQGFGGGAILGGGPGDSLVLSDSIIKDNYTSPFDSAAGISWGPSGPVTIINTVFSNNIANGDGGAILYSDDSGATLTITGSTFTGNKTGSPTLAGRGGAILLGMPGAGTPPTFNITGNTFVNNQTTNAIGAGGAIAVSSGTLNLQYNRIVGNTAGVAGSGALYAFGSATVNATENWWGCNTGPGGACNGALNAGTGTMTTSPYLQLRNTPSPAAVGGGGSSILTAGFLLDSATGPIDPANLGAMTGVPISWSATNGTLSGQQATIQSGGTATAILTNNNNCANSTGSATVDSATAVATLTVQCADLTAVKSNNAGGSVVLPNPWNWTIHVANGGASFADFANGETLLADTLPNSGLTYGAPAVSGASGLTGAVNCAIDGSSNLNCTAGGAVQLAAGGSFDVVLSVTPGVGGLYANPRPAGSCAVDPGNAVIETNDANNTCSNSVTVNAPPAITSADNTAFQAGSAGSFTIITTPGYPLAMTIGRVGALPSGVTFTDNGNGTATLAGTPAAGTGGAYPLTITAGNGILPNATQNFTLIVNQAPGITSASSATFTAGSVGTFLVTTSGFPSGASMNIGRVGALPSGVTFTDNGNGTATLAGTPAAGTGGAYPLTITAGNGILPNATQNFTLIVNQAPGITSASGATFTTGSVGTFLVTTSGFPSGASMSIGASGALPSGVTFTDNGNGTATLAGTPAPGTDGNYPIAITANNGVAPNAVQNFTLVVQSSLRITSADNATFTAGSAGSFAVTTSFVPPIPALSVGGDPLPASVTFTDNGDGTATLGGTPAAGTGGVYNLVITASNGVAPNAVQNFTLTVNEAPAITSANGTIFTIGSAGSFMVTTAGFPAGASMSIGQVGALPAGVTLTDNGDGTATLGGTPAAGTDGTYPIVITAGNGVLPDATQNFTLTIHRADTTTAITSDVPDPSVVGQAVTFNYTIGAVPPGVGIPTGSVTVSNGTDSCTNTVAAGACTIAFTSIGTKTLTATYSGDASFNPSTSATQTHTVIPAGTTTAVATSGSPSSFGIPVTFIATVTVNPPGAGTLTGTVEFLADGISLGTGELDGGGQATLNTGSLTTGSHIITAVYRGNADFNGSTSPGLTQVVEGPPAVSLIDSAADTGDGQVIENEHTNVAITQLLVVFNKDMEHADPIDLGDVRNPLAYSLVRDGSTTIVVNSITYDAGTRTATLNINGGVALPDGRYTLTVSGAIEDTLGASIGVNFVRNFFVDNSAPHHTSIVTVQGGRTITNGATVDVRFSSTGITFDEDVSDPLGSAGADDVSNPQNYLLITPGPDGTFDTPSCAAGLTGDDVQIPTGPVSYTNNGGGGPFVATVRLNGGTDLANGLYQLFICGTTSIVDLAGNPLNGGMDSQVVFHVVDAPITNLTASNSSPTLVHNPTVFTATASGNDIVYTWDLGDGSAPAIGSVVTHTYSLPGAFTATVTATNGSNSFTATTPVTIRPLRIFMPLVMRNHVVAPDLVVEGLVATGSVVTVTIRNRGNVPATDNFWVDVYFNPTETPSVNRRWSAIATHGAVWGVTTDIPAGGVLILTTGGDYYFPQYSSAPPLPVGAHVYALVDSINSSTTYGAVRESNEGNNLFGPAASTTSTGRTLP